MLKIFFLIILFYKPCFSNDELEQIIDKELRTNGVEMNILNKLTTKNYMLTSPLNQEIQIGHKKLIVYRCVYKNKKKSNSQMALIKFFSDDSKNNKNFIGWLFNDSPSISNLEDPVFNLRLKFCLDNDPIFPKLTEIK